MISIVIPTYNRVSSLQACVESIVPQYYPGLEIVIVDDCSTDLTREYLKDLAHYDFIKIYLNKENHGVNYSRNRGVELASQKFILFLDSDDQLVDGSLVKVKESIEARPAFTHFLYVVSDRMEEFRHVTEPQLIRYEDWLNGKVTGDFMHVVLADVLKKHLFFEEFRMFEHLNWLRVKKLTSPQILLPIVTAERERDRPDSLTSSSKLKNVSIIRTKFNAEKLYYSMYHNDLVLYNPKSLRFKLVETILLGAACNQKSDCRTLIGFADTKSIKMAGNLILLFPSALVRYGIIKYSKAKGR